MSEIRHVSDTAIWVAYYRFLESTRADALFKDPLAGKLVGDKGKSIARSMGVSSKYTRWNVVTRTVIIDDYVEGLISTGVDTVLNLGAGLDTRPYRMNLPPSLKWIEVDHPHLIDYKEKRLALERPRCFLSLIPLDLADRPKRQELLSQIAGQSKNVLVLTEGVLPYLAESDVSALADDLYSFEAFKYWIGEYFAKEVYKYLNSSRMRKRMKNAPFQFFPDDYLGFFEKRHWVVKEMKYLGEETLRLKRPIPVPWWARILGLMASKERREKFKHMTGYALFARN